MDVRVSLIPSRKLLFWNSAVSVAAILSDPERPLPICCLQRLYNKHSVPSVLPSHRPAPIRETLTHIQLFTGLSTSVRFIHFLFLPTGRRRRRKWCRSSSVSRCQTSESPPTSELTDQTWAAGMMFLFLFYWCEHQKVPLAGFHRVAAVNVTKHPQQIHFHQNRSVDCSMLLHILVTLQLLFSLFWLREDELTHQSAVYKVDNCNCNPIDYSSVLKCLSEGRRWEFLHVWVVMFAASSLDKYRLTLFVINVVMSHRHEVKSTCVYPADKQLPAFLVWGPTDVPPTRAQTLCLRIWGGPRDDDEFCVVCNTRQMFLIKDCIVMKDCKKL